MMQSMTGFAAATFIIQLDKESRSNVSMQLKSLNSRFFEANCKLPHQLSHLETELIKRFKKKLRRGYIYFSIYMDNPSIFKGSIHPSIETVQGYFTSIERIKKKLSLTQSIDLNMLIQLPNVFITEEKKLDDNVMDTILQKTNELIDQIIQERISEGTQLEKDIKERIRIMQDEIMSIEKLSILLIDEQKAKVQALLQEVTGDSSELAEMRKNALYATLDKMDIHEEIVRFKSHLEKIALLMDASEPDKGKKLDFTLQELGREINTIAAKCSDARIGTGAIDIKVEIEKAREQAQNIV